MIAICLLPGLMLDQVTAMTRRHVRAVYSGVADDEMTSDICQGKYQLVYMSPVSSGR